MDLSAYLAAVVFRPRTPPQYFALSDDQGTIYVPAGATSVLLRPAVPDADISRALKHRLVFPDGTATPWGPVFLKQRVPAVIAVSLDSEFTTSHVEFAWE